MRFLLLWLAIAGTAQEQGEPVSLHIKEVHRSQSDESNDKAVVFHITAVAESETISYSLQCGEIFNRERHEFAGRCFSLSAGKDYPARRLDTAINFWPPGARSQNYVLVLYDIVSEKEK